MSERPTLYDLMADNSLPDAARVIGFHVAIHDDGEGVELSLDAVSGVLNGWPGSDKCRAALRVLRTAGYIDSRPGGRGHADVHSWVGAPFSMGLEPHPKQKCVDNTLGLEPYPKDRVGLEPHAKPDRVGLEPHPKLPSSSTTSSSSTSTGGSELDERADEAIKQAGETLAGCRGALRDYLRLRVEPRYQYAYVQNVAGCVEGTDEWCWTTARGDRVHEGRTTIIAGALNELAQGDEIGPYFPGEPGDYRNLRSKIRYRMKSLTGAKNDATNRQGRGDPGEGRPEAAGPPSHQGDFPEPEVSAA